MQWKQSTLGTTNSFGWKSSESCVNASSDVLSSSDDDPTYRFDGVSTWWDARFESIPELSAAEKIANEKKHQANWKNPHLFISQPDE